jgi:hypothetical protein
MTETPTIRTTTERRRGFQPPWYTVQHIDCSRHGRTTWRANGAIGLRRTARGGLVPIRETFPGYCPGCQDEAIKAREAVRA